jgi:Ni/Fe-hydrogenase subunit HybB-like protein
MLSSRAFGLPHENRMLARLSKAIAGLLLLYVVFRLGDILWEGKASYLFGSGSMSFMFWLEIALFFLPAVYLLVTRNPASTRGLLRTSALILIAGTLYRFDAYLVAFNPGPGWSYFPSLPEILITVGLIALEILIYILLVKRFPILSGAKAAAAMRQGGKS